MTGGTIVIGVGNPYRRDDGVGPAVLTGLHAAGLEHEVGRAADPVLASSLGETAELIELWDGADLAIVVDAVLVPTPEQAGTGPAGRPGRVHRLVVHERPTERIRPASSHGLDFGEAVELARVLGRLPAKLVLYAIEVTDVSHGQGLTPAVALAAIRVVEEIRREVANAARAVPGPRPRVEVA
jgi:hydrogenase maturation protease